MQTALHRLVIFALVMQCALHTLAQSGSLSGVLYSETDGPVTMRSYDIGAPYLWPISEELTITFTDTLIGYPDDSGLIPQWLIYQGPANRSGYIDPADIGDRWFNFGNFSVTIPAFTFSTMEGIANWCGELAYYVKEIATGNLFGLHEYVALAVPSLLGFVGQGYDGYFAVAFGSQVTPFLRSIPEPPVALLALIGLHFFISTSRKHRPT